VRATVDPIIRASYAGTAVFAVASIAGAVAPDALAIVAVIVDVVLFALGCAAFLASLAAAAGRSRADELNLLGLWWLTGAAPAPVRRALLGAFLLEVAIALVTASVRPFTGLAFGVLVPVFGLGLVGLWSSRHGTFPPRSPHSPM
jgi:hypothetical protein